MSASSNLNLDNILKIISIVHHDRDRKLDRELTNARWAFDRVSIDFMQILSICHLIATYSKHYQNFNHKWRKFATIELTTTIQSLSDVIQYSIDLTILNQIETLIFVLLLHNNELLCQINFVECQFVCRNVKWMRTHCKQKHDWIQQNRKDNVSKESTKRQKLMLWIAIKCQRFLMQKSKSLYFVVKNLVVAEFTSHQA